VLALGVDDALRRAASRPPGRYGHTPTSLHGRKYKLAHWDHPPRVCRFCEQG
jgi:hypothetical protein